LAIEQEQALNNARAQASQAAKQEADLLADWQSAAEKDAQEALEKAKSDKKAAELKQRKALEEEAERTEAERRRAEAEKKAIADAKATEMARLRAEAAKRLRRQQLERDQAEQEALMKGKLSKDAFLKWRREREEELARLRSDRLALEQLAREELQRLREENERLKRGNPHKFVKKTFAGPTWCHSCKSLCWPSALQCTRCRYTIDNKCMRRNPPANCIASDADDEEDDSKLGAEQLATLEQLPTICSDKISWRPTTLCRANNNDDVDINASGNSHGHWNNREAVLKAGWLLLYEKQKKGSKLKAVINMARAKVEAFEASNMKEEAKEPNSILVRGKRAAHALCFDDSERRGTWWRILREQLAAARGNASNANAIGLGDKVLIKLWREDTLDQQGNITLSLPADALPSEAMAAFGKKVRLGSASTKKLGIYERRAPSNGAKPNSVDASDDRLLGESEPLHFLQGLREAAGKPIVFVVKRASLK